MNSMLYTISIVFVAMMFGGIMEKTNQLKVLVAKILEKAESTGSLFVSAVATTIAANLVLCDQYMSIVLGARTYAETFRERGLHAKNLSRLVEDSGTVTANLVPWNSGGAYQAGVLGVATLGIPAVRLLLLAVANRDAALRAVQHHHPQDRGRP